MSNSNKKNNKKRLLKSCSSWCFALGVVAGIGATMAGGAEEAHAARKTLSINFFYN